MPAGITVRGESRDDVTDPPEPTTGSNPNSRGDDKPEDSPKYLSVVDLTYAWNEEAQYRRDAWISHVCSR